MRVHVEGAEKDRLSKIVNETLGWPVYNLSVLISRLVRVCHVCGGMLSLCVEEEMLR
jgi:hypothetical protein